MLMPQDVSAWHCEHCREAGHLRPISHRVARCAACNYLLPRPREELPPAASCTPDWPRAAPDGMLRGRYRLLESLSQQAGRRAFLAQHEYLGNHCCVRFVPARGGADLDSRLARRRNEARAGFRVRDANVARVLDCDFLNGSWYFVTEYVDGVDLSHILALKQRFDWRQVAGIASDTARGLVAIHQAGLLHRGITPNSLMLGLDGAVRICDLGLAGVLGDQRTSEQTLAALPYMAPELFRIDADVTSAADLYALGAAVFHLLTGRPPHTSTHTFQLLVDVQNRPVTWPAELDLETPRWLIDLTLHLLAINPADRPASAAAVLERLAFTAEAALPRPAGAISDSLQPRGVGVLPFQNDSEESDDDWLGYAVANHLSRALSESPDVYVADQDGLIAVIERLRGECGAGVAPDVIEAGRLVGAGTVVAGHFRRRGARVSLWVEVRRSGRGGADSFLIEGLLSDLPQL